MNEASRWFVSACLVVVGAVLSSAVTSAGTFWAVEVDGVPVDNTTTCTLYLNSYVAGF